MKVLVLAPHTDDEMACAGSIARYIDRAEIRYVAFSDCRESVPGGYPKDVLVKECHQCMGRLGVEDVSVWDYPVRRFGECRQEILEDLVRLARQRPDVVLVPSSFDRHQDHAVIHNEGVRAFKSATVLGYELPLNLLEFSNTAFVGLTPEHMERKVYALAAYESQKLRPYSTPQFIYSLALLRGVQSRQKYAEAFEVIRLMI